jgi:hypothetical protein
MKPDRTVTPEDIPARPAGAGMTFRDFAPCCQCDKPVGHANGLLFYRIEIQRMAFDHKAVRQLEGVAMIVGSLPIAEALSPVSEIARPFSERITLLVCDHCALHQDLCIAQLEESTARRRDDV